jgi:hypothetical protein
LRHLRDDERKYNNHHGKETGAFLMTRSPSKAAANSTDLIGLGEKRNYSASARAPREKKLTQGEDTDN